MSLILSRSSGQGVDFRDEQTGAKSGITVLWVRHGVARMVFDGQQPFELHVNQWAPHGGDVALTVSVTALSQNQVKLAFDAPPHVKIVRTEIAHRGPRT